MIAGLPFGTWLLMALATLLGLILVVANYMIHSKTEREGTNRRRGHSDDG